MESDSDSEENTKEQDVESITSETSNIPAKYEVYCIHIQQYTCVYVTRLAKK